MEATNSVGNSDRLFTAVKRESKQFRSVIAGKEWSRSVVLKGDLIT